MEQNFIISKNRLNIILDLLADAHGGFANKMQRSFDSELQTETKRFFCNDGTSIYLFTTDNTVSVNVF